MRDLILPGDAMTVLKTLPAESVDCVITSPPYWGLRDYGVAGQLGLERTPEEFVQKVVGIFEEVRRILKKDGTLWLNLADSYGRMQGEGFNANQPTHRSRNKTIAKSNQVSVKTGLKPKNLAGVPWRVALALQAKGWYLRQDIIWHKPNPMPESVTDRCTKAHEYIFLMAKSEKYYFDQASIREPAVWSSLQRLKQDVEGQRGSERVPGKSNGRMKAVSRKLDAGIAMGAVGLEDRKHGFYSMANKRSVWSVTTKGTSEAHFATFPEKLIEPMILAGCPRGGVVLDPFMGAGTTAVVAKKLGRHYLGIELNSEYIKIAEKRIGGVTLPML